MKVEVCGLHLDLFLWPHRPVVLYGGTQLEECHNRDLQQKAQDNSPVASKPVTMYKSYSCVNIRKKENEL